MGWLVDFGLSIGANIPANVFVVGSATQGIIGTNELGTSMMLADYSSRVISVETQRTSDRTSGTLMAFNAGTATVKLLDMDGALDPYVLEQAGLTAPGVVMRIRWRDSPTLVYDVWYGYVDAWNPDAETPELGTVTVTGTDGFALLNQKLDELVAPIGAGDTASARTGRILDAVNWPTGLRSLGTTTTPLQATSFNDTALSLIQKAWRAEIGEFYQQPDGVLYARSRTDMVTDSRSATSQATFGSDRSGGEIPYVGRPASAWDKSQMHNRVVAQIDGSTNLQVAEDATSVGLYGTAYTVEDTSLALASDADALSWAHYVLATDVRPTFRFTGITLNDALEQLGVATRAQQFGRRMGDRVTVIRRPPAQPYGSIVDSRQMFIAGINHSWDAKGKQVLTTFDLSPAGNLPFFVIGSATQGIIGTNVIGW
jgi:hypothetical protein